MSQKLILITTILWTEAGSAAAKEKCNETKSSRIPVGSLTEVCQQWLFSEGFLNRETGLLTLVFSSYRIIFTFCSYFSSTFIWIIKRKTNKPQFYQFHIQLFLHSHLGLAEFGLPQLLFKVFYLSFYVKMCLIRVQNQDYQISKIYQQGLMERK